MDFFQRQWKTKSITDQKIFLPGYKYVCKFLSLKEL